MALRGIVFDLDGTLVDQEAAERDALQQLYESELSLAEKPAYHVFLRDWRKVADEFLQRFLDNKAGFDEQRIARFQALYARYGQDCPRGEAERLHAAYGELYRRQWRAYPESRAALEALRGRFRLGVITNGDGYFQRAKLEATGLLPLFESVVVSGEARVAKPDPAIFRLSEQALGLAPAELAYVGDRLDVDVAGARAAGWEAVWVDRKGMPGGPGAQGAKVVSELGALAGLWP